MGAETQSMPSPLGQSAQTNQVQNPMALPAVGTSKQALDQLSIEALSAKLDANFVSKVDGKFKEQCEAAKELLNRGKEGEKTALPFLEKILIDSRAYAPGVGFEPGSALAHCITNNPGCTTLTEEQISKFQLALGRLGERNFFASMVQEVRVREAHEPADALLKEREEQNRRLRAMHEGLIKVDLALDRQK
jgi:hypothetical protein